MNRFSVNEITVAIGNTDTVRLLEGFTYKTDIKRLNELKPDFPESRYDADGNRLPPIAKVYDHYKALEDPRMPLQINPFKTDLATRPWYVRWALPKLGAWNLTTVVHDYMLEHREEFPEFTRKQIDQVMREGHADQGVKPWRCGLIYRAVRVNSYLKEERYA